MIQRDSVKKRLETREQGISYTEFSYALLQAYDFLHLRRTVGCTVQLGGADQYGNIVAGIDLIRREFGGGTEEGQAFGITAPLVARSDGKKMSKSTGGALWMSTDTRDRTSPYAFYQYWINLPDADVVPWTRWYTFPIPHTRSRCWKAVAFPWWTCFRKPRSRVPNARPGISWRAARFKSTALKPPRSAP